MSIEVTVDGQGIYAFDRALRKFTRKVDNAGILGEAKSRHYFTPPSVKRRHKKERKRVLSIRNSEADREVDVVLVRGL